MFVLKLFNNLKILNSKIFILIKIIFINKYEL